MVATASRPPAAPRQCPIRLLVPFTLTWLMSVNTFLMAFTSATSPTNVLVACALM